MRTRSSLAAVTMVIVLAAVAAGQTPPTPAVPLNPVDAILDAFKTHSIVALSEGRHNNEQGHSFRLKLIRDPRFPTLVNDIVVESGTARYQDVMDRFIRGESVPDRELRHAWQDTTIDAPTWDVPIYEEFFRAVRDINQKLPAERRLRVLLGDPPVDWDTIASREQATQLGFARDPFAADLIQREVLSKKRRALLVFGEGHLTRQPPPGATNLTTRLGAAVQPDIFRIWTHMQAGDLRVVQPDVASWPVPSLAMTKGTRLGAVSAGFYRFGRESGGPMEDQFDAILYLGSTITLSKLSRSLCADSEYMAMRIKRMSISITPDFPDPPGVVNPIEALKQYCAAK